MVNYNLEEFFEDLWNRKVGLPETIVDKNLSPEIIHKNVSKYLYPFVEMQYNRLLMGTFRYGLLCAEGKPHYDSIKALKSRLAKYEEDGNIEHLIDIANFAFVEATEGIHPKKHFCSSDDGEHASIKK